MADSRERYEQDIAQNRAFFKDAVEAYRNDSIIIMDARKCFPAMKRPWPHRPMDRVRGMFVHHKASFRGYDDMFNNVVVPMYDASIKAHASWVAGGRKGKEPTRRHDRPGYTYGVDHAPELVDGLVVIWQFNDLDTRSWHSGAKGRDSERFTEWRRAAFKADAGFPYFLTHAHELPTFTLIMIGLGALFAFWFGVGRQKRRAQPTDQSQPPDDS